MRKEEKIAVSERKCPLFVEEFKDFDLT